MPTETIQLSPDIAAEITAKLGEIGLWLQAVGLLVILWLAWYIVMIVLNRKRLKAIYQIEKNMKRIEKKLDAVIQKKK